MLQFQNPDELSKPSGYSHVASTDVGTRTIYVAGQLPLDRNGKLVGHNDFRQQTVQVFENVRTALAAAGAEFRDVVKLTTYLTRHVQAVNLSRSTRVFYQHGGAASGNANRHSLLSQIRMP